MIIGIVAVDRHGAIGKGGQLPWHYSADMKHFKSTTMGHACVMGRKTWQTLTKPLPERLNLVLSREEEVQPQDSVITVRTIEQTLSLARFLNCDLFVIGGEKVYQSFLGVIEKWVVTEVPLSVEGADAFVPANYLAGFTRTQSKPLADDLIVSYYERG